jgi:hypothetical protein
MNSVNTCIAPWTESEDPDESWLMRSLRRSGYSSGQSQLATDESVWAWYGSICEQYSYWRKVEIDEHIASEHDDSGQKVLGRRLGEFVS